MDPFPLYLRVVDATTAKTQTGNYGDVNRDGVALVRLDERAAARVLHLSPSLVNEHRSFVFELGLDALNTILLAKTERRTAGAA